VRTNETTPVRARFKSALALLTVLASLAAPVCAPLCAGKICASSMRSAGTGQEPCHEMASMGANDGERYVATSKICGATDFPAALVKTDEQSLLWRAMRDDSAPVPIAHSSELALESLGAHPGRWGVHRVPLESKLSLLLTTILLRI